MAAATASEASGQGETAAEKPSMPPMRLGEELPIFCERCGYSLHGLPQNRCDQCAILNFRCPECGHHQPINTLRPTFQRLLGRMRAAVLCFWVLFKINYFFWLLFAWGAMGYEWAFWFRQMSAATAPPPGTPGLITYTARQGANTYMMWEPRPLSLEGIVAFTAFALGFGMVSRMLLLRWRRGWLIGLVLGALIVGCIIAGAYWRLWEQWIGAGYWGRRGQPVWVSPVSGDLILLLALTFLCAAAGASIVFFIWSLLVRLFLPRKPAESLLQWQRSCSDRVSALGRE